MVTRIYYPRLSIPEVSALDFICRLFTKVFMAMFVYILDTVTTLLPSFPSLSPSFDYETLSSISSSVQSCSSLPDNFNPRIKCIYASEGTFPFRSDPRFRSFRDPCISSFTPFVDSCVIPALDNPNLLSSSPKP